MADGIELDNTRFSAAMQQLAALTSKELEVEMRSQGKGVIEQAFNITPPASGRARGEKVADVDSAAQLRGENKIERDLRGIFVPVALRGERTITHLFGDTDPPVEHKPPYTVKTVEVNPDVRAIYEERNALRRAKGMSRGRRAAYYVDRSKYLALAAQLKRHIGTLASGYNAAAAELKARIPKYARGKTGPGTISVKVTPTRIRIVFTNDVRYGALIPDMQRRLQVALDLQAAKIERQIPYLLAKVAKQAGFQAVA